NTYTMASKKSEKAVIKPLGDRVLLRELRDEEKERKLASGIILPQTVKEDKGAKRAKVVAIGEGKYIDGELRPLQVSVGDIVLFTWGDELKVDGEDYWIVSESNLLGIVNE